MHDITPWGRPDSTTIIAPGIIEYSTPSHGGIYLDASRVAQLPPGIAGCRTFAGGDRDNGLFLEEDLDSVLAMLAFPEFFTPRDVFCALRTLTGCASRPYKGYGVDWPSVNEGFIGEPRERVERIAAEWLDDHKDHWECTGYGSTGVRGLICASYRHMTTRQFVTRLVSDEEYFALPSHIVATLPGEPDTRQSATTPAATRRQA